MIVRVVLVPFWRGLAPADFHDWFDAHHPALRGLNGAVAGRRDGDCRGRGGRTGGLRGWRPCRLGPEEKRALLERWARWHDVRVALGLVGTLAASRALAGDGR